MTCTTYTLDFVVLTFEVPGGHVDILANLGQITLKLREFKQIIIITKQHTAVHTRTLVI